MKCCECDKPKAAYRCSDCGDWYCRSCAESYEFRCGCQPSTIEEVKSKKGIKSGKIIIK